MEIGETCNYPIHVVIPAYNEAQSIGSVVHDLKRFFPTAQVAVINDGSADETAVRASAAGATVITHPFNAGYGVAFQTGLLWAKRNNARIVVTLDGDGQHDPASIAKLVAPVLRDESDITLGSRYLPDSTTYQTSLSRRLGSFLFAKVLSLLSRKSFTDPTTGLQCMNRKVLDLYVGLRDFPEATPDADMVLYLHVRGCRIQEVPVAVFKDEGEESMHGFFKSMFYTPKMLIAMLGIVLAKFPHEVKKR